jgi:HSP20 family protein
MRLVPWTGKPLSVTTWKDEFDTLFDSFVNFGDLKCLFVQDWIPRVDISESDSDFHLKADLPGMSKKNISIVVKDGVLTIEGQREEKKEEKKKKYSLLERRSGSFKRSFVLPRDVKEDEVKATFKNGVLEVKLPKTEKPKPKEIEIHG